jgi:hypothetical protein
VALLPYVPGLGSGILVLCQVCARPLRRSWERWTRYTPRPARVVASVDQATAAVATLEHDVTAEVLRRLLVTIEGSHRAGLGHSTRLEASARTVGIALQIDPRWLPIPRD